MFGLFLTGLLICAVMAVIVPFCRQGFLIFFASVGTLLGCLCTVIASLIGTAIFAILKAAATSYSSELNIGAEVGRAMLGFMWTASFSSLIAFVLQSVDCCCCRGRRKREIAAETGTA